MRHREYVRGETPPRGGVEAAGARTRWRIGAAACLAVGALTLGLVGCAPEPAAEPKPKSSASKPTAPPKLKAPQQKSTAAEKPGEAAAQGTLDKSAYSIDDPTSIWVVSNKLRPLNPRDFTPEDLVTPKDIANQNGQPLREPAARALETFAAAALQAGHTISITSAFRDSRLQASLYDSYIARDGQKAADTYSARPGHSEHQTGLTVDLDDGSGCALSACFGQTPAGVWLAQNAADHGFIVRYPEGKEGVTGFMPEPWHFRYVGVDLAREMRATGVTTLEEFFALPAAPNYAQE